MAPEDEHGETSAPRRWAVLGGSHVSHSHVRSLVASPHAEVVAVMDRHPERVGPLADIAGADAHLSLEDLLERDDLDAATIALPTAQHLSVAARLAERGVHVLCEKPLAATATEAAELVAVCEQAGVQLGTILNNRGLATTRWLREAVRAGTLDVRSVHVTARMAAGPSEPPSTAQLVQALGVHYLDLLDWWFGGPERVSLVEGPGAFAVGLELPGGVVADLRLSVGGPVHHGVSIEVVTASGRIHLDSHGAVAGEGDLPPLPAPMERLEGHPFGPGHLVVLGEAAEALAAGRPFPVSGRDGLRASALCDAVLAARAPQLVAPLPDPEEAP